MTSLFPWWKRTLGRLRPRRSKAQNSSTATAKSNKNFAIRLSSMQEMQTRVSDDCQAPQFEPSRNKMADAKANGVDRATVTLDPETTEKKSIVDTKATIAVRASEPKPKNAPSSNIVSPEATASLPSRWTYMWMDAMFRVGFKRPLELTDIWQLGPKWRVQSLTSRLENAWTAEMAKYPNVYSFTDKNSAPADSLPPAVGNTPMATDTKEATSEASTKSSGAKGPTSPSLLTALWNMLFWELAPYGILRFISDVANIISPFLIKYIVNFVVDSKTALANGTSQPPLSYGMGLAVGLLVLQLFSTVVQNYFFYLALSSGMALRAAFIGMIYRKSMRLSSASRQDFSSGKVTNIVSTDAARIETFLGLMHTMWTAPVQVLIITAFLISQLGYSAVIGVCLIVALGPLQGRIFHILTAVRREVAPLSDKRVKVTQEVLQGIRVLKFFTWERPFLEQIQAIRKKEVALILKRSLITALVLAISFSVPVLCASLAFVIYGINHELEPGRIFSSLTWFNMLRFPLMFLPQIVVGFADLKVALQRIQSLLLAPELTGQPSLVLDAEHAIEVTDGEFNWDSLPPAVPDDVTVASPPKGGQKPKDIQATSVNTPLAIQSAKVLDSSSVTTKENSVVPSASTLRNINLAVPRGKLVAVVGSVGSGKSSLLNALAGEMKQVKGKMVLSSRLGYAPQQAWIQNSTVKENILFGQPYDEARYLATIRDCSLERDLAMFQDGDRTQIGERGINLSGGQKQRINLARLVYFNSDIVLLDDPLSAVDAHVGRALFDNCICGALSGKTRILVTHQLHFLPRVDYIIVMNYGEVIENGTYSELMAAEGEFSSLMLSYGGADDDANDTDIADEINKSADIDSKKNTSNAVDSKRIGDALALIAKKDARELMQTEDRSTGTVKSNVWMSYFNAAGGWLSLTGLILILIIAQAARIGNDFWLVVWTNKEIPYFTTNGQYVGVYWGWSIFQAIMTYAFGVYFAYHGTRAARVLHEGAITRIVRAPVLFFDTTPLGRVINRFSKDQDGIDNSLLDAFRMFIQTLSSTISVFVLIIYTTPLFAAILVPILGAYYFLQLIYRATSRELKRLDSLSRSPLYAHIGETLSGLPTIRAYHEHERFIYNNDKMIDINNGPYFLLLAAQRWISLRFEILGGVMVFFAAAFGVLSRDNSAFTAALFGLSLSYAIQVTSTLNWCIRQFTDTEIAMNAVERVEHYAHDIAVEAAEVTDIRPPPGWPRTGAIEFKDVSMKYAPDLPLVLHNVSFLLNDKEKIGVVGRTGSGKSSLIQVLFRMVEPHCGSIVIDGMKSGDLGLKDLRYGLGIIPQDPVLFSGTFRRNLDPFNQYTDSEIWDALGRANIKAKVAESVGGLDGEVQENGENLSVGQRQLVCLARAILKKPRILIMDEATANVDYETDAIIQKCLREDFFDSTIITIAHRLNTIMDYDRVLVMDAGKIVEFDSPKVLLCNESGVFRSMVNETGQQNVAMFLEMVGANVSK
ncbi:hypothetical protein BASA50_010612 [Batrachochytrium salamandrivorans]|uniref:P-loop containing nucleoside triphosphate hydrolase protein n=1 Tax=Batrachochytrium salamandrivorans TaxID=1357716 RepID=A0ABQ8EY53_9FUNG|nr:hypothetical protein BASA50_010612 [Batrachochytrium salamandrivorans]